MLDSTLVRVTSRRPLEKGGPRSGYGAFPRRINDPDPHVADAQGRPVRFILTAGQAADIKSAPDLLDGLSTAGVIADKAYDSNELRGLIDQAGAEAVIPSNRSRKVLIPHDAVAYKPRNRIERFFNKLKHFRRITIRYDRRAVYFLAALHIASAMIWMR